MGRAGRGGDVATNQRDASGATVLDQVWDVGRLVDLSCTYFIGMPDMQPPLPSFELRELDAEMEELSRGSEYRSYTQEVRLCVQSGSCLETGAHMYPEMESIADIGLERLFVSALVVHIPKTAREKVTAADVQAALTNAGETLGPGEALLVDTGYDGVATNDVNGTNTPHFSYDAIDWIVQQRPAILGADMSNWHDGQEKPNFWPMLMRSGVLISPMLANLSKLRTARVHLVALPMKIRGACAAPCRLVAIEPAQSRSVTS